MTKRWRVTRTSSKSRSLSSKRRQPLALAVVVEAGTVVEGLAGAVVVEADDDSAALAGSLLACWMASFAALTSDW